MTDQGIEWEVVAYPSVCLQGKKPDVQMQKPGDPSITWRNMWAAHERVQVRRGR